MFELLVVYEPLGVVIISFGDSMYNIAEMEEQCNLASKIAKIPSSKGKYIHLIKIAVSEKTERTQIRDMEHGYTLNLLLSQKTITDPDLLKIHIFECIEQLYQETLLKGGLSGGQKLLTCLPMSSIGNQTLEPRIEFLRKFAARLCVLQNLECE